MHKKLLFFILLSVFQLNCFSQQSIDYQLAEEYFSQGEFQKAKVLYEKIAQHKEGQLMVYENYTRTLYELNLIEDLDKWYKKIIKAEPNNITYRVDQITFYKKSNQPKEIEKAKSKLFDLLKTKPELGEYTAQYLFKNGFIQEAKNIYLKNRAYLADEYIYSLELLQIYKLEKATILMCQEALKLFLINQQDKDYLKGILQDYIKTDEEFQTFEQQILSKIQENPTQLAFTDLLIWVYTQKRLFREAFIQTKSYDKIQKNQGLKTMELAKITMENGFYTDAAEMYDYVSKEFKNGQYVALARKQKILCKESAIKYTYPIDLTQIRALIQDYNILISELGKSIETAEAIRNQALLYAFYLDKKDTAKFLLEELISKNWLTEEIKAKSKLDLGDIYLLQDEPWESTLLYAQVEKSHKDQPLGYEAKLRNAKLSYYKGEFEYAKEHLNVLKLATHREIANDALDLSVFIQENILLDTDTNHSTLIAYSKAEWEIFQNHLDKALYILDTLEKFAKSKPIIDDILFLKSKVFRKKKNTDAAIKLLETIIKDYKYDIYGDDALFILADIYEIDLKDFTKASEIYNQFLIEFPASIYADEARKRYRILRGDSLN